MATKKIEDIEGIGPAFGTKLREAEITSVDRLLSEGCTKDGRKRIARATGLDESKILGWVNMADLFRIKGVGSEYAELLEAAGVDTVRELAQRNGENLLEKMTEVNATRRLTRRLPTQGDVLGWIEQAKTLPPKIQH